MRKRVYAIRISVADKLRFKLGLEGVLAKKSILCGALLALSLTAACSDSEGDTETTTPPNIIIFYADDLGYGDVSSYGATRVKTPNVDALAENGVKFTDAHATSATCTPSRYSLLTGEYGFRGEAAILPGNAPAIIQPGKKTIADMLREEGYATAVVGKWHLGLGDGDVDWNGPVKPGPLEIGFDYSFLLPATGDRVPTVYLEDHKVVGLDADDPITVSYSERIGDRPVGYENPELLKVGADRQHGETIVNGVSRIGYMDGGKSAEWVDEDFPDVFTQKAKDFMRKNKDEPFFLFFPFHDPHVPRLPHPRFQGATDMGPRGDAIVQMDWMTGEIMKELEALGLAENTLVIFTSDNGPVLNDGYQDQAIELLGDHEPAGPFRGGKYSAYEAGARVPTIAHWPARIKPGESSAVMSQVDIFASIAALLGYELEPSEAIDSQDHLAAWLGEASAGRSILFKQSVPTVTVRDGDFKYILPVEKLVSAGHFIKEKGIESGGSLEPQLFNLAKDPGEKNNIASENPELVREMDALIKTIRSRKKSQRK